MYRCFKFQPADAGTLGYVIEKPGNLCTIDFGHSIRFLKHADYVLISVYTAGQNLEHESTSASSKGDFLEAYFIDLIGLAMLEKAEQIIIKLP